MIPNAGMTCANTPTPVLLLYCCTKTSTTLHTINKHDTYTTPAELCQVPSAK